MLYNFLLGLLFLDSVILIAAILLQSGKGGGLAASFGGVSSSSDALFGTRQAGNLLTKTTWWGSGVFLVLAFILSMMSTRTRQPRSVLDEAFTAPPAAAPTGPAAPGTAAPGTTSPAVPLTPAPAPETKQP